MLNILTSIGLSDDFGECPKDFLSIAAENSRNLDSLPASKLFVNVTQNGIPAKRLEEGMPIRWGNETMAIPILPDGNYSSS